MPDSEIEVVFGGDFCPIKRVEQCARRDPDRARELLEDVAGVFRASDLAVVNLECPLTQEGNKIQKTGPCLKGPPASIDVLTEASIGLVTLANNHIRDFGDTGVESTLSVCSQHGVNTVGAGMNLQEAREIYYQHFGQRCLAVINVAENEFANATDGRGGANPFDLINLLRDIEKAKEQASHIILVIHGGLEHTHYPSPRSVKRLRFLAEQGVTAIIRHHPHCLQGYEVWSGVPIFYSLGNFLFDSPPKSRDHSFYGVLVRLAIDTSDKCTFVIHPFQQCKHGPKVQLLQGNQKQVVLARLRHYSEALAKKETLQATWRRTLERRKNKYYGLLGLNNDIGLRLLRKLGLLSLVRPAQGKGLLWQNLLRCEAHREALIDILERDTDKSCTDER